MTYPSQPGGSEQQPGGWSSPAQPEPTQQFSSPTDPTRQFGESPAQPQSAPPGQPYSGPPAQQPYPGAPAQPHSGPPASQYGAAGQEPYPFSGPPAQPDPYQYGAQPAGIPGPQPGYPYGYGQFPQQKPNNSLALVSMILALVGFATCITAPVGAILGHVAMRQIRERGEGGEGMAKTGIIVGWILTGLLVLVIIGYVIAIVFAIREGASTSSSYNDY